MARRCKNELMRTIGDRIKRARRARGWAQTDMPYLVDMPLAAVQRLESGRADDVGVRTLAIIAARLKCPLAYLVGGDV